MKKIELTVSAADAGKRVDLFLAEQETEINRNLIKKFKDYLRINGKPAKLSHKVKENEQVEIQYKKEIEVHNLQKEELNIPIVFEDDYLIVINKPYQMVVHPAKGNWNGTVLNGLYSHINIEEEEDLRPGIVHRLDKDTSGLLVIAKDLDTQSALMEMFKNKEVEKHYCALVENFMKYSTRLIDLPIGRDPKNRFKYCVLEEGGRESLTEYKVLQEYNKASLLELQIFTGRTHQIRVHMAHLGNPIIGDKIYSRKYLQYPMCLLAKKISFIHPVSKRKMVFEVPIPDYMQEVIEEFKRK